MKFGCRGKIRTWKGRGDSGGNHWVFTCNSCGKFITLKTIVIADETLLFLGIKVKEKLVKTLDFSNNLTRTPEKTQKDQDLQKGLTFWTLTFWTCQPNKIKEPGIKGNLENINMR